MCEFCVKHGDGKRWYLRAANYAEDLLEDIQREKYIKDFFPEVKDNAARWLKIIDRGLRITPGMTRRLLKVKSRQMKQVHFGQVIPLEDVEAIMDIVGQVVRLPCICRDVLEKKEVAACYLLAASPEKMGFQEIVGSVEETRPFVEGMERVDPAVALDEMAALEDQGMIHTVWTFITPFIGAICNCDPSGCLAVNLTRRGMKMYFPGEEVISVDRKSCTSCLACVDICQFDALQAGNGSIVADPALCHGCGICRRICPAEALSLKSRLSGVRTGIPLTSTSVG